MLKRKYSRKCTGSLHIPDSGSISGTLYTVKNQEISKYCQKWSLNADPEMSSEHHQMWFSLSPERKQKEKNQTFRQHLQLLYFSLLICLNWGKVKRGRVWKTRNDWLCYSIILKVEINFWVLSQKLEIYR